MVYLLRLSWEGSKMVLQNCVYCYEIDWKHTHTHVYYYNYVTECHVIGQAAQAVDKLLCCYCGRDANYSSSDTFFIFYLR